MEYRFFGSTGMSFSVIGLGGLLAHYEGVCGHPSSGQKQSIYRRADELGINLFDMGYGDEVYIPDEFRNSNSNRFFALKTGVPKAIELEDTINHHLKQLRRESIDVLRIQYNAFIKDNALQEVVSDLKQNGKVRSLCLIRHYPEDQKAYVEHGPHNVADGDLVMYNYVYRWQEDGIKQSEEAGKGVLIMKALGGQWISWQDKVNTDWSQATRESLIDLMPNKKKIQTHADMIFPINAGPWQELKKNGDKTIRTASAIQWVLENPGVSSVLVAVAGVEELEEAVRL